MTEPLKPCSSCAGTGEDFSVCPECNGIGFEYFGCCVGLCSLCRGEVVWWTTCEACKGSGSQIAANLYYLAELSRTDPAALDKLAELPSQQRATEAD